MAYERTFGLSPFFGLRREIDRLFDDAFLGRGTSATWTPAVDIQESSNELRIDFELPGIRPDDVEVDVENGMLTVRGEKKTERKEGDDEGRYHLVERSYGSFLRSFQLPAGVDEDQIRADFDQGVLHVRIPKAALPQPRRIQIGGRAGEQGRIEGTSGRRDDRGARRGTTGTKEEAGRERMVAEPGKGESEKR